MNLNQVTGMILLVIVLFIIALSFLSGMIASILNKGLLLRESLFYNRGNIGSVYQ